MSQVRKYYFQLFQVPFRAERLFLNAAYHCLFPEVLVYYFQLLQVDAPGSGEPMR